MLFNSITFLIFLPIVFLLYWFVFRSRKGQNLLIVAASYVFYGWWDWRFLLLIALTSFCSYGSGLLLERNVGRSRIQRLVAASNIVLNLAILGVFKYYNFFVENLNALFHAVGYQLDWATVKLILPVGISFYTFQALSYTIDVYRKQIRATHDIVEFFAYISFFPQLVAGPIERATNLLPQFQNARCFDYTHAVDGCRQMLWGFFKKLVVADSCALVVNEYWGQWQEFNGAFLFVLGVLFAFQIYGDFSGYSDIAIGCARLFGINLMRNFDYPYFSRSIPEFWRRWHISLTTWFRDYVYIPLGGSRCGRWKTVRNIFIVWAISGLWHGANWTFVCWGLFHATILVSYNILGIDAKSGRASSVGIFSYAKDLMKTFLTFVLAVIGWIIFRSENIGEAYGFLSRMGATILDGFSIVHGKKVILFAVFPLMLIEWLQRGKQHPLQFPDNRFFRNRIVRWTIYVLLVLIIFFCVFTGSRQSQTFIYFQF